jgi:hypothetical protein
MLKSVETFDFKRAHVRGWGSGAKINVRAKNIFCILKYERLVFSEVQKRCKG